MKNRRLLAGVADEEASRPCRYGSLELTFAELLLFGTAALQHHAAQLNLLLRRSIDSAPRYVKRAQTDLHSP